MQPTSGGTSDLIVGGYQWNRFDGNYMSTNNIAIVYKYCFNWVVYNKIRSFFSGQIDLGKL